VAPQKKTVRVETDTAKYYLNLESAFERLCIQVGLDPDAVLNEFQSIGGGIDVNRRYSYRCDLHDSWEAVVAKQPFRRVSGKVRRIGEHETGT
jgi:hypothetical protein